MSNNQITSTLIAGFPLCRSQQGQWNHHNVSIESVYARYKKMTDENKDLNTKEEWKDYFVKLTQLSFTDAAILLQRTIYPPMVDEMSIMDPGRFLKKEIAFAKRTSQAMMMATMRKAHPYDSFVSSATVPMTKQVFDHLFGCQPDAVLIRKIIRSDIERQKMVTDYVTFNHCFGCNYPIRRWKDGTTCIIRAPVYIY